MPPDALVAPASAVTSPPKPPSSTDVIVRFIATAICWVSSVPEAPTIMPATISDVLLSATPVAAALRPVKAFSVEMTTGMSAPPIGSTRKLPTIAALISRTMIRISSCEPATIATPQATEISSSAPLTSAAPTRTA